MIDPVTNREVPTNLVCEPRYPGVLTVGFCLSGPDWAFHVINEQCDKDWPHLISECGMYLHDK